MDNNQLFLKIELATLRRAAFDIGKRTATLTFEMSLTPEILKAERVLSLLAHDRLVTLDVRDIQTSWLDNAPDEVPAPDEKEDKKDATP